MEKPQDCRFLNLYPQNEVVVFFFYSFLPSHYCYGLSTLTQVENGVVFTP